MTDRINRMQHWSCKESVNIFLLYSWWLERIYGRHVKSHILLLCHLYIMNKYGCHPIKFTKQIYIKKGNDLALHWLLILYMLLFSIETKNNRRTNNAPVMSYWKQISLASLLKHYLHRLTSKNKWSLAEVKL